MRAPILPQAYKPAGFSVPLMPWIPSGSIILNVRAVELSLVFVQFFSILKQVVPELGCPPWFTLARHALHHVVDMCSDLGLRFPQ